ncbi:MAG: hypothetical protein U0793_29365 [Gemmataceae bacterium]
MTRLPTAPSTFWTTPVRYFCTSDFVRLEVVPKASFHGFDEECEFYEAFFESAKRTVRSSAALVLQAVEEAEQFGLSAVDALHVAAARRAKCAEFITAEKPEKPLFRVTGMAVISIR